MNEQVYKMSEQVSITIEPVDKESDKVDDKIDQVVKASKHVD